MSAGRHTWNIDEALNLRDARWSYDRLGERFGLSAQSVRTRLAMADFRSRTAVERQRRRCLACGDMFASHSVGNRICLGCARVTRDRGGESPFEPMYG